MSIKLCYLQELCTDYTNGTKRKVHHIRITEPCKFFLDMSCELCVQMQLKCGETLACEIDKIKRLKK